MIPKSLWAAAMGIALALGALAFAATPGLASHDDWEDWDDYDGECVELTMTLRMGDSDDDTDGEVSDLQMFLRDAGYYDGDLGYFGSRTKSAVKWFQRDQGLSSTGKVSASTRNRIERISCDGSSDGGSRRNTAPQITRLSGPGWLEVGEEGEWRVRATDSDDDPLSYTVRWDDGETTRSATTTSGSATIAHAYDEEGDYRVTVTASDGRGGTDRVSFDLVVESGAPRATSINPDEGPVGTRVTLRGSGFTSTNNSINFAGVRRAITGLSSSDGKTLTFRIPATPCSPDRYCAQRVIEPGRYKVSVTNRNGTSNSVTFEVTED